MLNRETFAHEMQALADRFNRTLTDDMVRRYYQHLQHLDTPTFLTAAHTIYRHDTFWPAPARFDEIAGIDPQTQAEAAWQHALQQAQAGTKDPPNTNHDHYWAALKSIGGVTHLGRTNERNVPFTKKEFIRAYTQAATNTTPALEKPDTPTLPKELTDRVLS